MTTKIITPLATASVPAESSGADYNKDAPLNAVEFAQNLVNLRAAVDRRLLSSDVAVGGGANLVPKCDASGNFLAGAASGTTHRMVKNAPSNYGLMVENSSATNPYGLNVYMSGITGGAAPYLLVCADNASRLLVLGNGNVQNVNNSYGAISDIKYKENITDVDPAAIWEKFKRYRFVSYNLKADPDKKKLLGMIAQEVELVSPSLVEETQDLMNVEVVNEEGETVIEQQPTGETSKGVKYSIVSLEAEVALQLAMARIEVLETRLAALEGGA